MSDDDLITVCAACLQASCWQGIFMCDQSRNANIGEKTRRELKALNLEHPSYWKTDKELAQA
jgi:hypothetical protein